MAKKKIVREMWAIVGQAMYPMCISSLRKDAVKEFIGDQGVEYHKPWSHWKKKGCRAIKVKVVIEEAR